MLAMARSPRKPSNLHWSTDADGSVKHTYSKNQIVAALQEARRAETTSDTSSTSTDYQTRELDKHRPSGSKGRAFGDDMTNVGRQGKEGPAQAKPKQRGSRGRRSLDKQDMGTSRTLTMASKPRIVLPEIVDVRISGECPVSKEFLKIVNRVGRAHNLIVRDPKTRMKFWAAVLVACHARFDPGAHLAFARFLFAWGSEYARYLKRKVRSERRAQKDLKALPSDDELGKRRRLYFACEDGDAWRPYAMVQAARRAEDERRLLQFVLQCKADTARRKAAEAKRQVAEAKKQEAEEEEEEEEERRLAEKRVRWFVEMMARETAKRQAESAASRDGGVARDAVARTTERPKGSSVEEALVNESAKQKASPAGLENDGTVVSGGVATGAERPRGSVGLSGSGSASMMRRQAASKSPNALAAASQKVAIPTPPTPYRSNGELKAYPTREDLQACWSALFDGRAIRARSSALGAASWAFD